MEVRPIEGLGGVLSALMLDVCRHGDPFVFAFLIHRHSRCWERRVGERTNRDCDLAWPFFQVIVDRRTTGRAEVVRDLVAGVSGAYVLCGAALDDHGLRREASLFSEDTAGPALACEAVANRDADRFAGSNERKLAATAGGCPTIHGHVHAILPPRSVGSHRRAPGDVQKASARASAWAALLSSAPALRRFSVRPHARTDACSTATLR